MLIVIEGLDHIGKSAQAVLLTQAIAKQGRTVIQTREVGGTVFAERIRKLLIESKDLCLEAQMAICFAARYDHIMTVINPALERGDIVVCDRFYLSTAAYQLYPMMNTTIEAQIAGSELYSTLLANTARLLKTTPLTVLLDMDEDEFKQRNLVKVTDHLAEKSIKNYSEMRQCYLDFGQSSDVHVIDASGSVAEVHERIVALVKENSFKVFE